MWGTGWLSGYERVNYKQLAIVARETKANVHTLRAELFTLLDNRMEWEKVQLFVQA
jgi:hypothetical protein